LGRVKPPVGLAVVGLTVGDVDEVGSLIPPVPVGDVETCGPVVADALALAGTVAAPPPVVEPAARDAGGSGVADARGAPPPVDASAPPPVSVGATPEPEPSSTVGDAVRLS
jgi:hypothetical protein